MNELKPEAFIVNRMKRIGYGSPRSVIDAKVYDPRKKSFWTDKASQDAHEVMPLVAIRDTHRVVSVELLGEITDMLDASDLSDYGDELRAIIDNKEQS